MYHLTKRQFEVLTALHEAGLTEFSFSRVYELCWHDAGPVSRQGRAYGGARAAASRMLNSMAERGLLEHRAGASYRVTEQGRMVRGAAAARVQMGLKP